MVVSVGGLAVGAEPGAQGQARPGPVRSRRRDLLRGLGAAVGALALAPVVAASRPARPQDSPGILVFDETYRGRRIRGVKSSAARSLGPAEWHITVDGRRLHLMRRADGTWLSMVDHYRSYDTPLEAVRAAVDELGPGERLRETGTEHPHSGGDHGLHP
ncbi:MULTISPECIES: tyrosinase family oxidase copper chaperone [unclassified Streptomyces]|uniref:tyrosinase family oxidase copper chaperone n=1 Tax=unclassified Streptomyces TaxID=2593676 RepID=UPI001661C5D9|nr:MULTISPECIES: tyrosinase family oxidase copper chaperone [unclassified Streptomyces]MBD0844038.1 tyrosinase co-factor [Streptomyces sp. TRM68416]